MQLYHVETLETVYQPCLKPFFQFSHRQVACYVVAFAVLLVYLGTGKQKFIGYLCKQRSETLLLLRCKSQVVKAYTERRNTIVSLSCGCTFQLVVCVLVNVPIHLVVVHQLGHADVAEAVLVAGRPKVIRKDLHYHGLARARFTDKKDVLVQFVTLVGEHAFSQNAVVEIVCQETQHLGVVFINNKIRKLTQHIVLAYADNQASVPRVFVGVCKVVPKTSQSSPPVLCCQNFRTLLCQVAAFRLHIPYYFQRLFLCLGQLNLFAVEFHSRLFLCCIYQLPN